VRRKIVLRSVKKNKGKAPARGRCFFSVLQYTLLPQLEQKLDPSAIGLLHRLHHLPKTLPQTGQFMTPGPTAAWQYGHLEPGRAGPIGAGGGL
jgi:hypothetical protein